MNAVWTERCANDFDAKNTVSDFATHSLQHAGDDLNSIKQKQNNFLGTREFDNDGFKFVI